MLNAVIIRSFIGHRGGNEHIPGRQDIPNCAHFSLEKYRKRNFFVYIDLVARPSHAVHFKSREIIYGGINNDRIITVVW